MFNELKLFLKIIKIKRDFWNKHKKYLPNYNIEYGTIMKWKVRVNVKKKYNETTGKITVLNISKPILECRSFGSDYEYDPTTHKIEDVSFHVLSRKLGKLLK